MRSPHGAGRTRAGTRPRSRPVNSAVPARSRPCFVCRGVGSVRFPSVLRTCGFWSEGYYVSSSVCIWGGGARGERTVSFHGRCIAGGPWVSRAVEFCTAVHTQAAQWLQYGEVHGYVYREGVAGPPTPQPVLPCALLKVMILLGATREAPQAWTRSTHAVNKPAPRAFRSIYCN